MSSPTAQVKKESGGDSAAPNMPTQPNGSSGGMMNEQHDAVKQQEETTSPPLSKKKRKKMARWEKAMERKRRRKQQDKEIKRARAIAAGRDLDEERRLLEERTKSGEGHRRREQKWLERIKSADNSFRICIDCGYNDKMSDKELNSLSTQIRHAYSCNKKSDKPVYYSVSGVDGLLLENLKKVNGFPDQWKPRAFDCSEKSLVEMHPDKSKLVYLTSDSENTLEHLENDKIYVIGGIVDRNRLKRAAIDKAESIGVQTAKLPISEYLELVTTKVLTCNHVFEILLKYRENGNDWKKAMLDVLPNRKDAHEKTVDNDDVAGVASKGRKDSDNNNSSGDAKETKTAHTDDNP